MDDSQKLINAERMTGEKKTEKKKRATLIYDGTCPICSGTVEWIEKNEQQDAFEMVPCQSPAFAERWPALDRDECMKAMHLVLPDGEVFSGEQALPEIFTRLRRYRALALLFKLPGAETLSGILYRWFALRRYSISRFFFPDGITGKHAHHKRM
jgi:predicted DCC family thiol-disulfide oxidoreductase YuxK